MVMVRVLSKTCCMVAVIRRVMPHKCTGVLRSHVQRSEQPPMALHHPTTVLPLRSRVLRRHPTQKPGPPTCPPNFPAHTYKRSYTMRPSSFASGLASKTNEDVTISKSFGLCLCRFSVTLPLLHINVNLVTAPFTLPWANRISSCTRSRMRTLGGACIASMGQSWTYAGARLPVSRLEAHAFPARVARRPALEENSSHKKPAGGQQRPTLRAQSMELHSCPKS